MLSDQTKTRDGKGTPGSPWRQKPASALVLGLLSVWPALSLAAGRLTLPVACWIAPERRKRPSFERSPRCSLDPRRLLRVGRGRQEMPVANRIDAPLLSSPLFKTVRRGNLLAWKCTPACRRRRGCKDHGEAISQLIAGADPAGRDVHGRAGGIHGVSCRLSQRQPRLRDHPP